MGTHSQSNQEKVSINVFPDFIACIEEDVVEEGEENGGGEKGLGMEEMNVGNLGEYELLSHLCLRRGHCHYSAPSRII